MFFVLCVWKDVSGVCLSLCAFIFGLDCGVCVSV